MPTSPSNSTSKVPGFQWGSWKTGFGFQKQSPGRRATAPTLGTGCEPHCLSLSLSSLGGHLSLFRCSLRGHCLAEETLQQPRSRPFQGRVTERRGRSWRTSFILFPPYEYELKTSESSAVGVLTARLVSVHSTGEAPGKFPKHPEFEMVRGQRGDSPAESAPARTPRSASLRARGSRAARACGRARVAVRDRASAPHARRRAASSLGSHQPQGGSPRARARLPAASTHPARASASRVVRRSKESAAGCATSARPHLPRGPTPRPGPAPTGPAAPPPGQHQLQPAQLPSAAARQGSRQSPLGRQPPRGNLREPRHSWPAGQRRCWQGSSETLATGAAQGSNGVQAGGELSHPWHPGLGCLEAFLDVFFLYPPAPDLALEQPECCSLNLFTGVAFVWMLPCTALSPSTSFLLSDEIHV